LPLSFFIVTAQLAATLSVALLCGLVWSLENAMAALLGGSCVVLPAAYLAWRTRSERSPHKLLMLGVGKFVLTCALLVIVIVLARPAPLSFFSTLVIAQLMYLLVPLFEGHRASRATQR